MANAWIEHVKRFQQAHGCSYKDALQGASASYSKGGNIIKTSKSAGKTLINAGTARAVRAINGSGVNRLKKAERWTDYADSTLHRGLNTAHKAQKLFGSGVNRLKKAERWTDYADSTLHRGLNTAHKAQKLFGSGVNRLKKAERWTDYADSTLHRGLNTAHKAQKLFGSGLKKHKRLSGRALYAAGY